MNNDGLNTSSSTRATMPDAKEQVKRLKAIQDKLWAILGLKMSCDRLKSLGYDVVVQVENGCTLIKVELKVDFDFSTGLLVGKDIVVVQNEIKRQIEELEGKK
jgi:hypothetical protein